MGDKTTNQLLTEMLEALNNALGGASQLIHSLRDPRWMPLREQISVTHRVIGQHAEDRAIANVMAAKR